MGLNSSITIGRITRCDGTVFAHTQVSTDCKVNGMKGRMIIQCNAHDVKFDGDDTPPRPHDCPWCVGGIVKDS